MFKNCSSTIVHKMEDNDPRPRRLGRRDGKAREETEAGPSVAVEELVIDKPRLGRAEQKHSIFLSHSGAQKAFVRRLRNALERNAYLPFFDEDPDSLRRGEPFVQRLKDAARLADVAIVVLSDDFFNSKWPMIELAIFIEEQRRRKSVLECKELNIFPLFMGFSVEEFRNRERRLGWLNKWYELGATDSRIDVSKWEDALGVLGGINGLRYSDFKDKEEYINSIVAAIFKLIPPDLKWEDTHVKGKFKFHQAVAEMFAKAPPKTRFLNVRTIGLYGMGGIGKTTICKSLCNEYFAKFNGKVWHAELGKKGIEEIQKDVLRHLVGASESLLNQTVKCKDQWRSLLRRKIEHKVFLAIDNVWNEDVSREQAECLLEMGFHPDSLVIVTSRNRELLEWLGIHKECCFEMPELDKEDATALEDLQKNGLVERWEDLASPFGMHELYSEFAKAEAAKDESFGQQLYLYHEDGLDVPAIMQMLPLHNYWPLRRVHVYNGGFSKLSSDELRFMVHVEVLKLDFCFELESLDLRSLKSLRSLEIRGCFELRIVKGLKDLKHLKFFRWNTCRVPGVALDLSQALEIVEIYGSKESKGPVIGSFEACDELQELTLTHHLLLAVVPDLHMLHKLELVDFSGCCRIEEVRGLGSLHCLKHLNLQNCKKLYHCYGLEKLVTIETLNLEGCEFLQLPEVYMWDLTGLSNLRCLNMAGSLVRELVFDGPQFNQLSVIGCASLRTVVLSTDSWKSLNRFNEDKAGITQKWTFGCRNVIDRDSFEGHHTINFSNCHTLESLGDIGSLRSLRYLYLQNCKMLTTLTDLSNSPFLEVVDLSYCDKLVNLGDIGPLPALQYLYLRDCGSLTSLRDFSSPGLKVLELSGCTKLESLGDIGTSLERLALRNCKMLTTLSDLSNSPFLEVVDLSYCDKLEDLGDIGPLRAVRHLDLRKCGSLRSLGDLRSPHLDELNLSYCLKLERLGDIGSLRSLRYLYLQNCKMLTTLPDLRNSPFLEVVDLSYCDKLQDLGDQGPLKALRRLDLQYCGSLRSLGDLRSPYLDDLNLSYCLKLERVGDIGSLRSLRHLNLQNCEMLTTLPDLSNLPSLEVVNLSYCDKLQDLGDLGPLRALRRLDLSMCGSLRSLGDLISPLLVELNLSCCLKLERVGDVGSLRSLRYLYLQNCKMLTTLPDLRNSPFLEVVDLSYCDKLQDLGDLDPLRALRRLGLSMCGSLRSLGDLRSPYLDELNLSYCLKLERVGDIGSMRLLRYLNLQNCVMLTALPDLSNLPFLEVVDLSFCDKLEDLGDIGPLRAVRHLDLRSCGSLRSLGDLRSPQLVELYLSYCLKLERLGDIGSLRSLRYLYLQNCKMLTTLPDLRNSPFLEVVDLSYCDKLQDLGDLGPLRALRRLDLQYCGSLRSLGDLRSPYLDKLDLSCCLKLERVGDIGSLRSLRHLNLQNCEMLTTLPDLSNLPSLEVVDLSYCNKLEDLSDIGPLPALRRLHLRDCASLTSLRDLGSPGLEVLDLWGCSKLESLGDCGSLRSLQELYLSGCK